MSVLDPSQQDVKGESLEEEGEEEVEFGQSIYQNVAQSALTLEVPIPN